MSALPGRTVGNWKFPTSSTYDHHLRWARAVEKDQLEIAYAKVCQSLAELHDKADITTRLDLHAEKMSVLLEQLKALSII